VARRNEGASPKRGCDRGATKPEGLLRENPSGGGSFGRSLRWLGTQSPLRGFSRLAASPAAKIPRRRTPRIFKAHSEAQRQPGLQPPSRASINAVVAPIRRFFWFIFCLRDVALDTSDCKRPLVRTFSPVAKQVRNRRSDWITTGLCPPMIPLLFLAGFPARNPKSKVPKPVEHCQCGAQRETGRAIH